MFDDQKQIEAGMPVLATCAGLILLAKDIKDQGRNILWNNPNVRQTKCIWKTSSEASYNKRSRWSRRSPNDIYPRTIWKEDGVKVLAEVDGNIVVGRIWGNRWDLDFIRN